MYACPASLLLLPVASMLGGCMGLQMQRNLLRQPDDLNKDGPANMLPGQADYLDFVVDSISKLPMAAKSMTGFNLGGVLGGGRWGSGDGGPESVKASWYLLSVFCLVQGAACMLVTPRFSWRDGWLFFGIRCWEKHVEATCFFVPGCTPGVVAMVAGNLVACGAARRRMFR